MDSECLPCGLATGKINFTMGEFKILLADATPSVRQFIRYTLQDNFRDIEYEVASNGKNIQKRLEHTRYDLVIYDRDLPMLGGEDMIKWLRSRESSRRVFFIMMSSDANEQIFKRAIELGADGYLIKPLLQDSLVQKVREIYEQWTQTGDDRRKHRRVSGRGSVLLRFKEGRVAGRLVNISMGGLLARIGMAGPLPYVYDAVKASVNVDNSPSLGELEGSIIRIAATSDGKDRALELAVMFMEGKNEALKKDLLDLITSMKS